MIMPRDPQRSLGASDRRRLMPRMLCAAIALAAAGVLSPAAAQSQPDVSGQGPSFVRFIGRPAQQPGVLNAPLGIAVSPTDERYIFVVDSGNARVQVFQPTSSPVVGQWGRRGSGPGDFWLPSDVALNPDGSFVYVVDSGRRVVMRFKVDALCLIDPGCTVRPMEWGGLGRGPGLFQEPTGLAIDRRGNVYVADRGASEIQVFDPDGSYLRTISGPGHDPASVLQPTDIAIGPDDKLWVADTINDRITWFQPDGKPAGFFEGASNQRFFQPTGVAVARDGSFVVRDFDPSFSTPRMWRFNASRQLLDHRPLDGNDFGSPKHLQGVAFLPDGDLVFADAVAPDFNLFFWPKDQFNYERFAMRGRELTQFDAPAAAALDEQFLAVSDAGNQRVLILNGQQDYQPAMVLSKPRFDFDAPDGVAVHRKAPGSPFNEAVVYIADPGRNSVFVASPRGEALGRWGTGVAGTGPDSLAGPEDVAVDAEGKVYIADTRNNRVVRRDGAGNVLGLIGGDRLKYPNAVAIGPDGHLYVLERGGNRLLAFTREGELIYIWPESAERTGVVMPGTVDQYVAAGELWAPVALAADDKYVYVLENDMWRHVRVQVLRPMPGKSLTADGSVVATFADAQGAGPGQVFRPLGVAASADGRVVLADSANNRMQLFSWKAIDPTATPTATATSTPTATAVPPTETPTEVPTVAPTDTATPPEIPSPTATRGRDPSVGPVPQVFVPVAIRSVSLRRN